MPFLNLDLRLETLAEVGHGDDTGEVSLPYRLPFDSLTSLRYLRLHTDGGAPAQDRIRDGALYGWSFLDPDGHQWELIHLDLNLT